MAWLVRDGKVLATVEVVTSARGRTRGLLGRDGIDGAMLLRPARSVHTFKMRFPIDVAFCDADQRVVKVLTLVPNRITRPVWKARSVIECEAGMLRRWGVRVGDVLDVRDTSPANTVGDASGAPSDSPSPSSSPSPPSDPSPSPPR